MNSKQIQAIADKHGLGNVFFQFNVAQNTGRSFEVGYVSDFNGRQLFCKRGSDSNPDQFRLCNEYANLKEYGSPMSDTLRMIAKQLQRAADQFEANNYVDAYANSVWAKDKIESILPEILEKT